MNDDKNQNNKSTVITNLSTENDQAVSNHISVDLNADQNLLFITNQTTQSTQTEEIQPDDMFEKLNKAHFNLRRIFGFNLKQLF
jgi:hypothetical protein